MTPKDPPGGFDEEVELEIITSTKARCPHCFEIIELGKPKQTPFVPPPRVVPVPKRK